MENNIETTSYENENMATTTEHQEEYEKESKLAICALPTQYGKTFTAISRIQTEIDQDHLCGKSLHIIHTMNTLTNSQQFAARLKPIADMYKDEVNPICVLASKYTGKYKHIKDLAQLKSLFFNRKFFPRVIVCCSNSIRYTDCLDFITNFENPHIERIFVYYDELHMYISDARRYQIELIHNCDIVKCIIGLTATPDKILQETGLWSRAILIKLDYFEDEQYAGYEDMIFNCVDDFFLTPYVRSASRTELATQTVNYIEHVLNKFPQILGKDTRSFIPAHCLCASHYEVRDLIFRKNSNAVVVVLNGKDKILQFKDGNGNMKTIPLMSKPGDEMCKTICDVVKHHDLLRRPLVITGFMCVEAGQTLTHKNSGPFTSAIIGHMDLSNDAISQLFGRTTGRMKKWRTYVQTQIYCPTIIRQRVHVMETCVRNIAFENSENFITKKKYRAPMYDMQEGIAAIENLREKEPKQIKQDRNDIDYLLFDDQDSAIQFAKNIFHVPLRKRQSNQASCDILEKNGGQNPTVEYLLKRKGGLSSKILVRMEPTNENKWCIYWKTSSFSS